MSERPQRFGLQAWLVAAFIAIGAIASIAVMLVVLPRLESSIRAEQARQAGADLILELRDRRVLSSQTFERELQDMAIEIGGDVRLSLIGAPDAPVTSFTQGGYLQANEISPAGRTVADELAAARYVAVSVRGRQVVQAAQIAQIDNLRAVVEAAVPVRGAEGQIAVIRRRVLLATGIALALATLAGIGIARLLGARIRSLADTARTLAGGDLTARARDTAPQELTTLSGSLNAMAARLEDLVAETVSDRDRARALVASLAEGVLAVSDRGEVTVANAAAQRLLGLPRGAESLTLAELPETVRAVVADAGPDADTPHPVSLPGGVEALVSIAPLARGAGVVLTLRDVTEERQLARARRDLIANVSHELKTPLTAVKGFLELLERPDLDAERRAEFLELMSGEVARLERLVAEQLELARLDAGALALECEPVDLGELAATVAETRRLLAEREGIALVDADSAVPVIVSADPARLEQILLILLDNAIKHTGRGGKITVAVGRAGAHGTLSVRDTGVGIPLESQAHVFDRFFQADPSRQGGGLGLGLAIARGLAEAHGGSIEVRSQPQIGTVFTVRIPMAAGPVSAPPRATTGATG